MPRGWPTCNMRRFHSQWLGCLLLLAFILGCQQEPAERTVRLSGATMGTTWSVSLLPAASGSDPASLQKLLQQRLDRINGLMSTYDPASEISRFNAHTSNDWFAVSDETAQVVELALQISRMTEGAFDISVGPLVELWGFGASARSQALPTAEQVTELLARVGYRHLQLRRTPPALKKSLPQLHIDLSAIAKGYAVDQLAALLKGRGIDNFLVEVGGEMQLSGERGDGTPWRIAIEKPLEETREVEKIFPLTTTAVATSGNYRNYYIENGQRYVHTIDPASGRPIRHKLASATVLDLSCARADALATALMVMGELRGRRFCETNNIAAFFLIHEQNAIVEYESPAFQKLVQGVQP